MRAGERLEKRRADWAELEKHCDLFQGGSYRSIQDGRTAARLAMLYRGACSDLAMAETYQLPPVTVEYLHRLVARAHNQLYRSKRFEWNQWWRIASVDVPRAIFSDNCVHVAAVIFFGLFSISAVLARSEHLFPTYASKIVGDEALQQSEDAFEEPLEGNFESYAIGAVGYIQHNTSIGLTCFGKGPLIIPCIIELAFQAVYLGAVFGYMARPGIESGDHFFQFVTAHGPFELTAIALSAAAGLRLGVGLVATAGLRRLESFKAHALRSLPIVCGAVTLFILAAFTEGFLSPSPLPYAYKALWAICSSTAMMFYFVVLGYPRSKEPWN
ncbi:MAG: stage II sporulation protein M [Pirellulaceae bacterium]|nr:stage II sporulation protein M [Pirellulaceae bacterium]